MRVKICGITQTDQGNAIANLGATTLGFICVRASPRYVSPSQLQALTRHLPDIIEKIGVFADAEIETITTLVRDSNLTGVQLHGTESPEYCRQLRQKLPSIEILKAFKIRTAESLNAVEVYRDRVDTFLLDAYHPQMLGGTGQTLDWQSLHAFSPSRPWLLAGGLTPENIKTALTSLQPQGIDLSSGVERSPGDKDLEKVARLFEQIRDSVR
ncbi:MAG: phosphoribosylanthranilate isomerase [Jaaginema sp. PMC 1079.18]|nr:phosphoribosylanthranilate isomerase [Jaaginema sp. PMC 1080.18]MEC4851659.1 phosphoribosylanthranilate isomerase [Jaaginema sp. PMC 1079.18]MEC4867329.1 phosphoribosylanthranilate isomerase [Jaaginema sp. PMC 1078.18]